MSKSAAMTINNRANASRKELAGLISEKFTGVGLLEIFPGVGLARACSPTEALHSVFTPAFCVIAQGSKKVQLGEETFQYDTGHYLIATVDLPIVSYVLECSEENPYLSFKMDLDPTLIADVLIESGIDLKESASVKAMDVSPLDEDLLDAVLRIVRLLDKPDEAQMMLPLIKREIIFRLLKGNQAGRLLHLFQAREDRRISRAIDDLRKNFDRPLRIESIARDLGMSVSGFHHHFKSVTAMSPLQFHKQIRLQEARRLMLGEDLDAATAGFRVGYEDPSYFSRDYKKHFGVPPQRDVSNLRQTLEAMS